MHRLTLITLALLIAPGCFIAVGVDDSDNSDPWWDKGHAQDPNDDDPVVDSDTDTTPPALMVSLTLDPGQVPAGTVSLVTGELEGDAGVDDLVSLTFGGGVDVLALRVRDDGGFDLALDVPNVPEGAVDATLDFGDLGTVILADALWILPGDGSDPGTDDTGTDPSHPCP